MKVIITTSIMRKIDIYRIQQWGILGNDRKIDPVIYNNDIKIKVNNICKSILNMINNKLIKIKLRTSENNDSNY